MYVLLSQGWRIEIKKYPRLTEFGAWRGPRGKQYGGFYTQEQVIYCLWHNFTAEFGIDSRLPAYMIGGDLIQTQFGGCAWGGRGHPGV